MNEWRKTMVHLHYVVLFNHKSEKTCHVQEIWTKLEIMMLSEISHIQTNINVSSHIRNLIIFKDMKLEEGIVRKRKRGSMA
jgi:hypothetical protein